MLTIHATPPDVPILVGRLISHRSGRIKGRPVLACAMWCPWCRSEHQVEMPDPPFPMEAVTSFNPPCRSGPLAGLVVMVGLDPDRHAEHGRLIRHHGQALRRWRVEQRFRHDLAESRAIDRRHVREGWGI